MRRHEKKTRPAAKQGARNVLRRENTESVTPWTGGAQIALSMPLVAGMLCILASEAFGI